MKVICLTPWSWKRNFDWLRRDLGLLAGALKARGHQAALLLHRVAEMPRDTPELQGVDPDLLGTPDFWCESGADLVITLAGSRPQEFAVNQAIRNAGIPLWNKMDSDGVFGGSIEPWLSLYGYWWRGKSNGHRLPWLRSALIHAYRGLLPARGDRLAVELLEPCSKILLESPIAVSRMRRFFHQQQRGDIASRVTWLPSAIPDDRIYLGDPAKANIILAVGRWADFMQKDTPKLFRVLNRFFELRPDYRAKVVGLANERVRALWNSCHPSIRNRIELTGRLASEELNHLYQTAKICLFTSRGEGFPNVGGEAVSCGCSVVGPAQIASMHYFASSAAGTLSWSRSDGALLDALNAEVMEWDRGARNPIAISTHFRREISAPSVAARVECLFEESILG